MAISQLAPAQRFMYEYGCFIVFWGNFEIYMETVIWRLSNDDPIETGLTHFRVLTCQCPDKSLAFGEVMSPFK